MRREGFPDDLASLEMHFLWHEERGLMTQICKDSDVSVLCVEKVRYFCDLLGM